jgi:hypothetical protein
MVDFVAVRLDSYPKIADVLLRLLVKIIAASNIASNSSSFS